MSYQEALEAAGAKVLAFEQFGSYQGDWIAKVTVNDITGWVTGSYGSCSGCDAFEAEFGWGDDSEPDYQKRLADFGKDYLEDIQNDASIMAKVTKHIEWDVDAEEMVSWLKANGCSESKP